MIRFVDVRFQGLQNRFAFWDTVTDTFESYNDEQAWKTWADFEEDFSWVDGKGPGPLSSHASDLLKRYRSLCPLWVFGQPTEEELDFPEERFSNKRFVAHVTRERREQGVVAAVDEVHVFNDAASRDAFVAEFPEGRRAVET